MLIDGEKHKVYRSIMNEAFKKEPMQGYLEMMPGVIHSEIEHLSEKDKILAFPFFQELTLSIATKVFFGLKSNNEIKKLNRAISAIVNAALKIPINLPFTKFGKGIRARSFLVQYFHSIIKEKRKNPGKDLCSRFCTAQSEEGNQFTDQEIIDHLIFVLLAAHDTTAITLTVMTYYLSRFPDWQAALYREANDFLQVKDPL